MRFMVIVKVTEDTENEGAPPDPQLMADLNKFNDELLEAGVLIGYDGLHLWFAKTPADREINNIAAAVSPPFCYKS